MKAILFSNPIKNCLRIILLLAILFLNFGSNGISTVHAAGSDLLGSGTFSFSSLPYSEVLDTTGMHTEATDPAPADYAGGCEGFNLRNGLATVWYKYVPLASSPVYLDTSGSTTNDPDPFNGGVYEYDTYIAVYTSSNNAYNGTLTMVACNDNPNNDTNQAQLAFNASLGTNYFIQIGEYDGVISDNHEYPGYNGGSLHFTMSVGLTISGNVGISGAVVSYKGGATTADSNGNYTLAIPSGFTNTVTPSHPLGAVFSPPSTLYIGVSSNQTLQNYTAARTFPDLRMWTTDFSYSPQGWQVSQHPRMMGDVNNDGKDDIIGFGYTGVWVALSNGSSFAPMSLWTGDFSYGPQGWRTELNPRMVADVNGDGRVDAIGFGYSGVWVALSNGSSFAPMSQWTTDFSYEPQGWRVANHPRMMGDVNNDGKDDIIGFGYTGVWVALSTGSSFAPMSLWTGDFSYGPQGWRTELNPRMVADVNGDGRVDAIGFGYSGVWVALSNGSSFAPMSQWTGDFSYSPQGWRVENHPRLTGDMNGDGRDDIIGFGYSGVWVALSNGSSFAPMSMWSPNFSYGPQGWRIELNPRMTADPNGDGLDDLVGFGYSGVWINK